MPKVSVSQNPAAAGFIIYKKENNKLLFLGLIALEKFQTKNKGIYDVPKGRLDRRETPLQAAYRECREETGLKPKKVVAGPFQKDRLCLWIAEECADPTIGENPETGQLEHLGFKWVTPEDMMNNCLDYLQPFVKWAHEEICKLH